MTDLLFEQLLNTLLRVVAVLVVATVVVSAMRRSSASLRALALTATLTGTLVLPLISLAAPPLEIAVLPAERAIETPMIVKTNSAPAPIVRTAGERTIAEPTAAVRTTAEPTTPSSDAPRTTLANVPALIPQVAQTRTARDVATAMLTWLTARISITTLLVGIWIIGALLFLTRLALGHRRLGALVSSASNAGDDWHTNVDDVQRELGIRRRVDVRTSHDIDIPAVAGVTIVTDSLCTSRPGKIVEADTWWASPVIHV